MRIAQLLRPARKECVPDPCVDSGDYFCSGRRLYRVEQVVGARAVIEDCRTGDLFDVAIQDLLVLRRLRESRS